METFSALLALCAGNSPVPVNSPHKGQWRGALMFSLICVWIDREAGDLRPHRGHYDVNVMHEKVLILTVCSLPVTSISIHSNPFTFDDKFIVHFVFILHHSGQRLRKIQNHRLWLWISNWARDAKNGGIQLHHYWSKYFKSFKSFKSCGLA